MKTTMGCGGWARGDVERGMDGRGRSCRASSAIWFLPFVLCPLVLLSGCDKAAVEKAQQEAREAKTAVQQLKHNLALAEKEITKTKEELVAVQQSRDQLQAQIDKANRERDEALEFVQKAHETLARASSQVSATAALQKQVADLTALAAEQRKQIEELLKGAAAEPVVAPPTLPTPAEPNEGCPPPPRRFSSRSVSCPVQFSLTRAVLSCRRADEPQGGASLPLAFA